MLLIHVATTIDTLLTPYIVV